MSKRRQHMSGLCWRHNQLMQSSSVIQQTNCVEKKEPEICWNIYAVVMNKTMYQLLYWNGQLVWTPALGLYLCVDPRHVERRVT